MNYINVISKEQLEEMFDAFGVKSNGTLEFDDKFINVEIDGHIIRKELQKCEHITPVQNQKRDLYRILSEYTSKELPWGILTGIRPVKLISNLIENYSERALDIARREYMIDISRYEISKEIIGIQNKVDYRTYSLYVHIPFCPDICSYCSFSTFMVKDQNKLDRYVENLIRELEFERERLEDDPITIYIGGGTPTALSASQLDRLLEAISKFKSPKLEEFTVEAGRADTICRDKLEVLKKHGVDRISINIQSAVENTLKTIGRRHSLKEVYEAYKISRDVGFKTVNMDIIVGLPFEGIRDNERTFEVVKELEPEHLTVHSLSIKKGSELYHTYSHSDIFNDMLELAKKRAKQLGFRPYYLYRQKKIGANSENIGYTRTSENGIYNIYMIEDMHSIVACGLSAVSKIMKSKDTFDRLANVRDLKIYLEDIEKVIKKKENFYNNLEKNKTF